jgi:ATP-dependent DNA helicase DinG
MPSRLAGAFPDGVEVRRLGLAEAVAATRAFLAHERGAAHAPPDPRPEP